jgi:Na+-transporting NADH:ubiquinone oxidoreductase subunit NqrE
MPIARSLEEQHRFDLAGKSSLHYLWLALAVFMPSFTVFALIVCARTRLKGRKWPWIVFILFGVGAFSINWATGQLDFSPIRITLLSAGVFAAPLGPWVVSFSLPVGAFVFLARRKGLAAAAANSPG